MRNLSLSKSVDIIYFFVLFVFLLIFYTLFHPAWITTPDDWFYITYTREALPLISKHNPTRVMPEVMMPIFSHIFSLGLRPIIPDFIKAIAYGTGAVLAGLITCYCYQFFLLLRQRVRIDKTSALVLTSFFLLFHFLSLRTQKSDNPFLLGSLSLTNFYYYTIPTLLNATLVFYFIRTGILSKLKSVGSFRTGFLVSLVYICLLSNLYANIILAVYFFLHLSFEIIEHHSDWRSVIHRNWLTISGLLLFGVILIFESRGGNAKTLMSSQDGYFSSLWHTCGIYLTLWHRTNLIFRILCFVLPLISLFFFLRDSKENQKKALRIGLFLFLNYLLVNLFSIFLSAAASPQYVAMQEKMLMEYLWVIVALTVLMAYCLLRYHKAATVLPLIFVLLFCHTNTKTKTFNDVILYDTMPSTNERFVDIMKRADALQLDSVTLYVPLIPNNDSNWPYLPYVGPDFSQTFYSHRITHRPISIDIQPVAGLSTIYSSLDTLPANVQIP